MKEQIRKNIENTNQKYLKGMVYENVPERLERQLEEMDWSYLDLVHNKKSQQRGKFEPLAATEISEIREKEEVYRKEGLAALKAGKVGAILLAGGQGTRLGFDKAKGMFNIGVNKKLYIFMI